MANETDSSRTTLLLHHDFRLLWVGDTISQFGTQISVIALPYLAVTVLGADELQMGVLTTLEFAGFLLIGLPAGAWVDRWRRQRVLVSNDVIRALALASIPIAYYLGSLTFAHLCIVALLTGIATVFFDVAYQSYLPSLVERAQLTEGNSKLEASRSVAQVAGPGLTGGLIKIAGAPLLVLIDALSPSTTGPHVAPSASRSLKVSSSWSSTRC